MYLNTTFLKATTKYILLLLCTRIEKIEKEAIRCQIQVIQTHTHSWYTHDISTDIFPKYFHLFLSHILNFCYVWIFAHPPRSPSQSNTTIFSSFMLFILINIVCWLLCCFCFRRIYPIPFVIIFFSLFPLWTLFHPTVIDILYTIV